MSDERKRIEDAARNIAETAIVTRLVIGQLKVKEFEQLIENEIIQQVNAALEEAANAVPLNWLDPLLTGDDAVISNKLSMAQNVELLLKAVHQRICALKIEEKS